MEIPKIGILKNISAGSRKRTLRTTVGTLWMIMTIILAALFITTSSISLYIFYRINTNVFSISEGGGTEQYRSFDKGALSQALIFHEGKKGETITWTPPKSSAEDVGVTATSSIDRE
jgi:hypothetical protein